MKATFAIIAALLAAGGNLPYLWDILKGKITPHPYTWFVWSLVSGIIFFGQIAKGAGIGALPTGVSGVFILIIFALSLKNGFKEVTKIDTAFLFAALAGIVLWLLTEDPTASIIIAVGIDLIAFMPTIRKTWQHPQSETPVLYSLNLLRHTLALFSLQTYNIATALHSVAMIAVNTLMVGLILLRRPKK